MSAILRFTILGSGSSGGVPRADGGWGVCDPANPRNRRSRCSFLVRRTAADREGAETTVLVDTSPELRLQTSSARVSRIDGVLFTHDHADQTGGLDDLRAFFLRSRAKVACYADADTRRTLLRRFDYVFETAPGYPAICEMQPLPAHGVAWALRGPSGAIPVSSYDQDHGFVRSVGFRFGDVAYSADVVALPPAAMAALRDLDVFVIDALRDAPHPTHAHVARALEWIEELKPRRAILTNLHVDLDYAELAARLPKGVEPAYDGLTFESAIGKSARQKDTDHG